MFQKGMDIIFHVSCDLLGGGRQEAAAYAWQTILSLIAMRDYRTGKWLPSFCYGTGS